MRRNITIYASGIILLLLFLTNSYAQGWKIYDAGVLPSATGGGGDTLNLTAVSDNSPGPGLIQQIVDDNDITGNKILKYLHPDGKLMYRHNFDASYTDSSMTLIARVKGENDPVYHRAFDLQWRNGNAKSREELRIWPKDSTIELEKANLTVKVDKDLFGWHTYRIAVKGDEAKVYIDEDPTVVISGISADPSTDKYVKIGDGSSDAVGGYLDWCILDMSGAYAPGEGTAIPASLFVDGKTQSPTEIFVASGESIQAAIDGASSGDIIVLADGGVYSEPKLAIDSKKLTIKAADNAESKPVITITNDGFEITGSDNGLVLKGLTVLSPNTSKYFIDLASSFVSAQYIKVFDTFVKGFGRTIIRGNRTAGQIVDSLIFDNSEFYDFGVDYRSFQFQDRLEFYYFQFTNCTHAGFAKAFLWATRANKKEIIIDNCTFDNFVQYSEGFIKVDGTEGSSIKISDCLLSNFADGKVFDISASFTDEISNTRYFNVGDVSNTWNVETDFSQADPAYADAANQNFMLPVGSPLLTASSTGGPIGDPRWVPVQDSPYIFVASGESIQAAIDEAVNGKIIVLSDGGVYTETKLQIANKQLTIKAADNSAAMPKVTMTGIEIDGSDNALKLDGIEFLSDGGPYFIDFVSSFVSASNLEMNNIKAVNFGRSIIRANRATYTCDSIKVIGSQFYGFSADYRSFHFYDKLMYSYLRLENSTFADYSLSLLYSYSTSSKRVEIVNCTIDGLQANADRVIKLDGGEGTSLFISNTLFTNVGGTMTFDIAETVADTIQSSRWFAVPDSAKNVWSSETDFSEKDPGYLDAANYNFTIPVFSPLATAGIGGMPIGDPRWVPSGHVSQILVPAGKNIQDAVDYAVSGDVIILEDGGVYDVDKIKLSDKKIVIKAEDNSETKPLVNTKAIELNGADNALELRGIEFAGGGNPYFIDFVSSFVSASSVKVYDVKVTGFGRSIIRGNRTAGQVCDSLIFDGCEFYGMNADYRSFHFYDKLMYSYFRLANSTIGDYSQSLLYSYSTSTKRVEIENCTIDGLQVGADRVIRLNGGEGSSLKITNTLFTNVGGTTTFDISEAVADTIMNSRWFGVPDSAKNVWSYEAEFSEEDPFYADAANYDYSLPGATPLGRAGVFGKPIGDPRWVTLEHLSNIYVYSGQSIQAAVDYAFSGDTLTLADGGIYTEGKITIKNKELYIKAEDSSSVLPIVTLTVIEVDSSDNRLKLENIEFKSDGGNYFIDFVSSFISASSLELYNVKASGFGRTVLRGNRTSGQVCDTLIFDGCEFYDFDDDYRLFHFYDKLLFSYFRLSNSTVGDISQSLLYAYSTSTKRVEILNCTIDGLIDKADRLINLDGGEGTSLRIENTLITNVGGTTTFDIKEGVADTVLNSRWFNLPDQAANTWSYEEQFTEFDPGYADPATFNYKLPNGSPLLTASTSGGPIGDPRWAIGVTDAETEDILPTVYNISQNYPNPFNPATTIKFQLPKAGQVTLYVYNTIGQLVSKLIDDDLNAGYHTITFDASSLSSGIYFYRIKSGDYVDVKKMMLLK